MVYSPRGLASLSKPFGGAIHEGAIHEAVYLLKILEFYVHYYSEFYTVKGIISKNKDKLMKIEGDNRLSDSKRD